MYEKGPPREVKSKRRARSTQTRDSSSSSSSSSRSRKTTKKRKEKKYIYKTTELKANNVRCNQIINNTYCNWLNKHKKKSAAKANFKTHTKRGKQKSRRLMGESVILPFHVASLPYVRTKYVLYFHICKCVFLSVCVCVCVHVVLLIVCGHCKIANKNKKKFS